MVGLKTCLEDLIPEFQVSAPRGVVWAKLQMVGTYVGARSLSKMAARASCPQTDHPLLVSPPPPPPLPYPQPPSGSNKPLCFVWFVFSNGTLQVKVDKFRRLFFSRFHYTSAWLVVLRWCPRSPQLHASQIYWAQWPLISSYCEKGLLREDCWVRWAPTCPLDSTEQMVL